MRRKLAFILIVSLCTGCAEDEKLMLVSVEDYEAFVVATDYVTDAERYGWSVIQEDVYSFRVDSSLTWSCLLYTSPSPRDKRQSRMPSSA